MSLAALSKIVLEEFMNFSKHSIDRHYPMCRVMTVGGTGNDGHLTNIKKKHAFLVKITSLLQILIFQVRYMENK